MWYKAKCNAGLRVHWFVTLQDDVQEVLKLQYYLQYVSIASLNM